MDNNVTISNVRDNVLEFDLTIEGLSAKDVEVQFVIKGKGVNFTFAAEHDKGNKWKVTIPKMATLEKTTYNCSIVVIADGYYFEPMKSNCTVVGTHQVYTSAPVNKTVAPAEKVENQKKQTDSSDKSADKEKKQNTKMSVREGSHQKTIKQLVNELTNHEKTPETAKLLEKTINERRERQTKIDNAVDARVREVLNASSLAPKLDSSKLTPTSKTNVPPELKTQTAPNATHVPLAQMADGKLTSEPEFNSTVDEKVREVLETVVGIKRVERNKRRFSLRDN